MSDNKIYYMRDNHTFKLLDNNPDIAIKELEHEFVDKGYSYGMIKSSTHKPNISVGASGCWDSFKKQAIIYLKE